MKQLVIALTVFSIMGFLGCSVPGKPAMRIAISNSPGSAIFFLAQEEGLFEKYDVDVQIVELNSGCECALSLIDDHVDAVVVPYSEFVVMENAGSKAGIVMLLAAPAPPEADKSDTSATVAVSMNCLEILVGNRADLIVRRQEWQRVLLAYEHARLLVKGEPERQATVIAYRERRAAEDILRDLQEWSIFGIIHQDSLLAESGPYNELGSNWHGRMFLKAATLSSVANVTLEKDPPAMGYKVR